MDITLKCEITKTKKQNAEGLTIYKAIASTIDIDRDGEIVVPYGCDAREFLKNPVLLGFHDRRQWPIGKVETLEVKEKQINFDFVFAQTEEGQKAEYLYSNGFMTAFSIGFAPKEYIRDFKDDTLVLDYKQGQVSIPVKKLKNKLYGVISKWELREISCVPIGANPAARLRKELTEKAASMNPIQRKFIQHNIDVESERQEGFYKSILDTMEKEMQDLFEIKGIVPIQVMDFKSIDWDSKKSLANVAVLASNDGSAKKETIDWIEYSKAFTAYDFEDPENFSSYSLLHHDVDENNKMFVNMNGVYKAMAELLGDQKAKYDRSAAYDHLINHYYESGEMSHELCPEFKDDYTPDQLEKIAEGKPFDEVIEETKKEPKDKKKEDNKEDLIKGLTTLLKPLQEKIDHICEDLISLSIQNTIIDEKLNKKDKENQIEFNSTDNDEIKTDEKNLEDIADDLWSEQAQDLMALLN